MRRLVVNADDFGLSPGVNRGIARAHEYGIVTSASLMVHEAAADGAADYARTHPSLGIGLHLDLGEWRFEDGEWRAIYQRVLAMDDRAGIQLEIARQLDLFRQLVGRDPSHLDSHQHVHRREPVLSLLSDLAKALDVPLRHFSRIQYSGEFYGQTETGQPLPHAITSESLIELLIATRDATPDAAMELCCHPAAEADFESAYRNERLLELEALCDARVRATITENRIRLSSFGDCA